MSLKYVLLLILLACGNLLWAQKETTLWHFGPKLTLDFSSSATKFVVSSTSLNTLEGSASICDRDGRLLFYTDGVTVWSADHKAMPHGSGLKGHRSSTNSALILPKPGDSNTYYIITSDEGGYNNPPNDGIHYSIVNMCLNNGLGDVVEATKNTFLLSEATEKLAAVRHSNGEDIWIMMHKWKSDEFYAYLLTHEGIESTPVISRVGQIHTGDIHNTIGQMKFSTDGKKLCLSQSQYGLVEVFNFDAFTGKVSHPILIDMPYEKPKYRGYLTYGVEFSPDASKLYVSTLISGFLHQYDLTLPTQQQICNSIVSLRPSVHYVGQTAYHTRIGGLQLGMDGKIYAVRVHEDITAIGVINPPNLKGESVDYQDRQIITNNSIGYYNFPAFMASYFSTADRIDYQPASLEEAVSLWVESKDSLSSVSWLFGEETNAYTTTGKHTSHLFTQPGSYTVQATVTHSDGSKKTLHRKITVQPSLSVELGKDTLLCAGQNLTLDVSSLQGNPVWQDGSTASTYSVTTPGTYWVEVCRGTCLARDSIVVTYLEPPKVDLGADRFICDGKPVTLVATSPSGSYLWSDGSSNQELTVSGTGTYYVSVITPCGGASDTIKVTFEETLAVDLGGDLTHCVGDTLLLDAYSPFAGSYQWQILSAGHTLSSSSAFPITEEGTYSVELRSEHCFARDTIHVIFLECEDKLYIPNVITPNGDGKNDEFVIRGILKGRWHLDIYNRYGKVIYTSTAYQNDWDGSSKAGNIFYYYFYHTDSKRKYKGWLQVLR